MLLCWAGPGPRPRCSEEGPAALVLPGTMGGAQAGSQKLQLM